MGVKKQMTGRSARTALDGGSRNGIPGGALEEWQERGREGEGTGVSPGTHTGPGAVTGCAGASTAPDRMSEPVSVFRKTSRQMPPSVPDALNLFFFFSFQLSGKPCTVMDEARAVRAVLPFPGSLGPVETAVDVLNLFLIKEKAPACVRDELQEPGRRSQGEGRAGRWGERAPCPARPHPPCQGGSGGLPALSPGARLSG